MLLKDTLRILKRKRKMTTDALSTASGVPRGTINKLLNGETTNPTLATLRALAAALSCPIEMLTGELDTPSPLSESSEPTYGSVIPLKKTRVPIMGTIAAGRPIGCEETIELFDMAGSLRCSFALRVQGDSMIGAGIRDGSIALIRAQSTVSDGEIAAVVIDDTATLKRVYHTANGLSLVAENPKYAPIFLQGEELETVRILGKAVGYISTL